MEVSEFRVNNLIHVKSTNQYVPICCVEQRLDSVVVNMSFIPLHKSEIEPIPLTEEWLLKFGFKNAKDSRDPFLYITFITSLTLAVRFCGEDAHFISWNGIECEGVEAPVYVHRLQNLYHALTGEELTLKP